MKFLNQKLATCVMLALMGVNILSLIGFLGNVNAALDLFSHFRVQYFGIQLLALIILLLLKKPRRWQLITLTTICMIINGWQVATYWSIPPIVTPPAETSPHFTLRVMQMNVFVFNHEHQKAIHTIQQENPDLVSIQEVTPVWLEALRSSQPWKKFPYRLIDLTAKNVLLSRFPFQSTQAIPIPKGVRGPLMGESGGSIFVAQIKVHNTPITIINLHPPVPVPVYEPTYRHYLDALQKIAPFLKKPVILVGDLNTTPWSIFYRRYLTLLNLKDARATEGFLPTWPTSIPFLQIPIDHVFVSSEIGTIRHHLGPFNGSDHFPIIVDLRIPQQTDIR